MLTPVLVYPDRHRDKALALADYCRALDGTEVLLIKAQDTHVGRNNIHGCRAAEALHLAARSVDGPFLWMECDSIPRKRGFLYTLERTYKESGKPFMLSSDSQRFDLVGGIGVYDPVKTLELIPTRYDNNSWDLWMIQNIPELIHRTPLIQHSYARYFHNGNFEPHQFPRDSKILREDAVIFHADKEQSLMVLPPEEKPNVFLHSGDLGDIVASLAVVKSAGGGHYVVANKPAGQRETMSQTRYKAVEPLLLAQEYLHGATYDLSPKNVTHDFTVFRNTPYRAGHNLAQWHGEHLNVTVNLEPWLRADPDPRTNGKVVIARSARYRNPTFPWAKVLELVKGRAVFVGTDEEHLEFPNVPRIKAGDLLELAQLIAGAKLFVGNQSCPFWIAAGLGVPLALEVWPQRQDCIIKRDNAFYPQTPYDFNKLLPWIAKKIDNRP